MKKINRFINNLFFQKNATSVFGKTYLAINKSNSYRKFCKELHSVDFPCWNTLTKNQLDFLINHLRLSASKKILDIGSGNGELTKFLTNELGANATGIDFSILPINTKSTEFINGNFIEFRELDNYDSIISIDSFYMINNYKKYFEKIMRHLSPRGKAILIFTYTLGEFEESKIYKALTKLKIDHSLEDFTQDDLAFWKTSRVLLDRLNGDFVDEGYFNLWNIKKREVDRSISLHRSNNIKRLALVINRG